MRLRLHIVKKLKLTYGTLLRFLGEVLLRAVSMKSVGNFNLMTSAPDICADAHRSPLFRLTIYSIFLPHQTAPASPQKRGETGAVFRFLQPLLEILQRDAAGIAPTLHHGAIQIAVTILQSQLCSLSLCEHGRNISYKPADGPARHHCSSPCSESCWWRRSHGMSYSADPAPAHCSRNR